ncbi:MAG: hypothetical protein IJK19_04155 [Bacteroidales bacterium]|nr:hypothetical protein [Bacteroidales bacterium]
MTFADEFAGFIAAQGISCSREDLLFSFPEKGIDIRLVPIDGFERPERKKGTIYLYEDRWRTSGQYIRERILAHLGIYRKVFARKCDIKRIDAVSAAAFLDCHHSYGTAKAKYKYGMFLGSELVAVSLFSSPRTIPRDIEGRQVPLRSFEWVRYASLSGSRISGGMSRMLARFVEDTNPDEVMTYADLEWSDGSVYSRMGFHEAGLREPVTFWVNPVTFARERTPDCRGVKIRNFGSLKYLKQYIKP